MAENNVYNNAKMMNSMPLMFDVFFDLSRFDDVYVYIQGVPKVTEPKF